MATLDGVKINLGGRDYTVPPLTLRMLRKHGENLRQLSTLDDIPTPEQIDAISAIVLDAMCRNYPELTKDDLDDLVDMRTLPKLFRAVAGQSGLTQGGDPEGAAGETAP